MLVHFKRLGAIALLAAGATVLSPACVRDDSTIFIRGCLAIPPETCVVTPTITSETLGGGIIDSIYGHPYDCALMVGNQLVERGDPATLRTETSRVSLYEADVQILNAQGQVVQRADGTAAQFATPVSGFVDPGASDPGYGVTFAQLLDFETVQELGAEAARSGTLQSVVAAVVVHGRTLGGLEVHTNEFRFPIDVCQGCLCSVPAGEQCVGGQNKPTANCRVGRDRQVDCRLIDPAFLECSPTHPTGTCPAPGQTPANPCG